MSHDGNDEKNSARGRLDPLDEHIISMLSNEQWTTGALIDTAEQRVIEGELEIDDIEIPDDPDELDETGDIIKRQDVYDSLRAFKKLGSIEYAHEPTSLYRLVYDPRSVGCNDSANG